MYMGAISTVKMSVLLLYLRIFSVGLKMRYSLYTLFSLVLITLVIGVITQFLRCRPALVLFIPDIEAKCHPLWKHLAGVSAANIVTDILTVIAPLPVVLSLQLGTRQKAVVIALLSTGLL